MVTNKRFINTLFDIFGYSFVGFLAYCFGLVLQNYNNNGTLFAMLQNPSQEARHIILVAFIQIILIFWFGCAYATVILHGGNDSKYKDVCTVVEHWIESAFLCVIVFLVLNQILVPNFLPKNCLYTILISSAIYVLSFLAYHRLNIDKFGELKTTTRYVLICPAAVMIGFNVFAGANIYAMLDGNFICLILGTVFFVSILGIYISHKKYLKWVYGAVSLLIALIGILSLNTNWDPNTTLALKNFFLASIVTVFLSIFEAWYAVFRQLGNCTEQKYARVSMVVVALMPPFVALLYPIQDFNFIYFLAFWLGMAATDWLCFSKVLPAVNQSDERSNPKTKREIAIARALCGIITLVCLMLDKYWKYNPKWFENDSFLLSNDSLGLLSFVITILALLTSFIPACKNISKDKSFTESIQHYITDASGHLRLMGYITIRLAGFLVAVICSYFIYGFFNGDPVKSKMSSFAIIVYIGFSGWLFYKDYSSIKTKEGNNE